MVNSVSPSGCQNNSTKTYRSMSDLVRHIFRAGFFFHLLNSLLQRLLLDHDIIFFFFTTLKKKIKNFEYLKNIIENGGVNAPFFIVFSKYMVFQRRSEGVIME